MSRLWILFGLLLFLACTSDNENQALMEEEMESAREIPQIGVLGLDVLQAELYVVNWGQNYENRVVTNTMTLFSEVVSYQEDFENQVVFRSQLPPFPTKVFTLDLSTNEVENFKSDTYFQPTTTPLFTIGDNAKDFIVTHYLEDNSNSDTYLNAYHTQTGEVQEYYIGSGEIRDGGLGIYVVDNFVFTLFIPRGTNETILHMVDLERDQAFTVPYDLYCCSLFNLDEEELYLFESNGAEELYRIFDFSNGSIVGTASFPEGFRAISGYMPAKFYEDKMAFLKSQPAPATFPLLPGIYNFTTQEVTTISSDDIIFKVASEFSEESGFSVNSFTAIDIDLKTEVLVIGITYLENGIQKGAVIFTDYQGNFINYTTTDIVRPLRFVFKG